MGAKFQLLPVKSIELDRDNPRIRRFLDDYADDELNYAQIALALDVAGGDGVGQGVTTPEKLRNSILTNEGISQPIIVNKKTDGTYVCIEGNTRLYIYRSFIDDGVEGEWKHIPALVHDDLTAFGIDSIRLQAHLVGPRPWDAYSKAKYQWELAHNEKMPLDSLVALCGGDRRDVQLAINAYADMEKHFRPLFSPGELYDTSRFSGFVEVQNNKIKTALLSSGLGMKDFASWLKNGNITRLTSVRKLPQVLKNPKARDLLIKKNIEAALDILEKPELTAGLKDASISQLCRALSEKIGSIQYSEIRHLRDNPDDDAVRYLVDAYEALQELANDIKLEM